MKFTFDPLRTSPLSEQKKRMKGQRRPILTTAAQLLVVAPLLILVAFCSALYLDGRQAAKELPSRLKALDEACASFPIVDAAGRRALEDLKRSISHGDAPFVQLKSGEYNEGVYEPFPGSKYKELQLARTDVIADGKRLLTARLPTLVLPTRGISLNQPPERTRSCPNDELLDIITYQADNRR